MCVLMRARDVCFFIFFYSLFYLTPFGFAPARALQVVATGVAGMFGQFDFIDVSNY